MFSMKKEQGGGGQQGRVERGVMMGWAESGDRTHG